MIAFSWGAFWGAVIFCLIEWRLHDVYLGSRAWFDSRARFKLRSLLLPAIAGGIIGHALGVAGG